MSDTQTLTKSHSLNIALFDNYLVVPRSSSESWDYLPVRFTHKISSGSYWMILRDAELYQFGIMNSAMHMAWIKCVSGKLDCYDRVHYSPSMKNFPWPINHTQAHKSAIEEKARVILAIRAQYPAMPLADLYTPMRMPAALFDAHRELDKAVDAAYGQKNIGTDHSRIGYLLELNRQISSLLVIDEEKTAIEATMQQMAREAREASRAAITGF